MSKETKDPIKEGKIDPEAGSGEIPVKVAQTTEQEEKGRKG